MRSRLFPFRTIYLSIILAIAMGGSVTCGVLRGTVLDATNARPLANVRISIGGLSALTNATGSYVVDSLPPGTLGAQFSANPLRGVVPLRVQFTDQSSESSYTVTATAPGFFTYTNQILAIGRNDTGTLNISLSPALSAGQMRLVLRWGRNPRDLDAHLLTDVIQGRRYHIQFGAKGRASAIPFDTLDVDDTDGFGPETISMYRLFPGRYVFYVERFAGIDSLPNSRAVVEVYSDAGLAQTIQIPTTGSGDYWHVCEINGSTGAITLVNQIVSTPPSNAPIATPSTKHNTVQSSVPARIASWLWDFGDGDTSTLPSPSHIYRRFGAYTVSLTVQTDNGSQAVTTRQNIITAVSQFAVTFREPSLVGSNQIISISPPPNANANSGVLFYRQAGRRTYDSLALAPAAGNLEGLIPASAITIRGLEYFARINGAAGVVTYPEVLAAVQPAVFLVPFNNFIAPITRARRQFKMISTPVALSDATARSVFADDFGEYNSSLWRLFRWSDTTNLEFPQVPQCRPGTAFWLVTAGETQFDVDNGTSVTSERPFPITLAPGWNQISTPFAFPVAWDDITGIANLTRPYTHDGVQYQPDVRVLQPWEGYFLLNDSEPRTILVSPVEAQVTATEGIRRTAMPSETTYRLQIFALLTGTELRDSYTSFGFLQHTVSSAEQLNYQEPPPIADYLQVSIVEGNRKYMSLFKPVPSDGASWDFEIRTSGTGNVECTVQVDGSLPPGFRSHIFDLDDFTSVPFEENSFSASVEKGAARHFKLIIGTEEFMRENSGGIPLRTYEYALEQNFPNPFNPTTTIRYQLKRRSQVKLEVFDVVGRLVRTLANTEQLTGTHSEMWDGTNERGVEVSSGVYFYRLHSGDFTLTRKLLFVK